jgi:hypothetical protein
MKLRVTGADGPFWLVLGESHSKGWVAKVDGKDVGGSRLVDGYANGWRIDPRRAHTMTVTLTWTPQRQVWIALALSGITMLLCTALALGLWSRRRAGSRVAVETTDHEPVFRPPLAAVGRRPGRVAIIAGSLGTALVTALLVRPLAGLLVGALVFLALARPRWRTLLALGAPASLGLAGLYVVGKQWRFVYPSVFEWPTFFDRVAILGWLAVVFLVADALVEELRTRRRGA